jgi:hypothetical protein
MRFQLKEEIGADVGSVNRQSKDRHNVDTLALSTAPENPLTSSDLTVSFS